MTEPALGIVYLDGHRLNRALVAGIHRVIADQEHLNKINVFPVPDGDTGTNIALTMGSILGCLSRHEDNHAGKTLTVVADAALDGARGNSGAIFAQFFQGLSDAAGDLKVLNVQNFSDALSRAADYAREALSEPMEGTILTVLSDFARSVRDHVKSHTKTDFKMLMERGLETAKTSLAKTQTQLEVLRKAGVVDAGAQGFMDLIQGIADFIRTGSLRTSMEMTIPIVEDEFDFARSEEVDLEHRYCTECVITGEKIARRKLRETLASLGGSLVMAGTHSKLKVHIHVDEPAEVFRVASRYGAVTGEKADDMQKQQHLVHSANARVAVLMDSAGDVPDEELEALNIQMLPVRVHFGDKSYLDKVGITLKEFIAELQSNAHFPKTSQPAPGDFRRLYQFLSSHYENVISIHVTAKVSGTHQAAVSAASRLDDDQTVRVIDSRSASLGQGLIAMYAAECAQEGYGIDETVEAVKKVIDKTQTFALLGDLAYTVRGGRVSKITKVIADLLRITPVLRTLRDGRVSASGVLFGRKNTLRKFVRYVAGFLDRKKTYRIAVGHAESPERATRLAEALDEAVPNIEKTYATEIGTALAVHGGAGTLVVAFQEYEPPASA